jgi:hypothetical protein
MGKHGETDAGRAERSDGSANVPTPEAILTTGPSTRELDSELAKPRRRRGLRSTMLLGVGVLLAAGFFGGLLVGRSTAPASATLQNLPGNASDGFTAGTISRVDGDTIYVETADGETVEVRTSDHTDIQVTTEGTVADLAEGETVVVQGDASDDGSLDATSIVEGGAGFGGFGAPDENG